MSLAGYSLFDRRGIRRINGRTVYFKRSLIPNAESQIRIGINNVMSTDQRSGISKVEPLQYLLSNRYPRLLTDLLEVLDHPILSETIAIKHEWPVGSILWIKHPNKDTSNDRVVMITELVGCYAMI